MKRGSGCCAVDIYCTAALTSFSDNISYITYLFSEWRIVVGRKKGHVRCRTETRESRFHADLKKKLFILMFNLK